MWTAILGILPAIGKLLGGFLERWGGPLAGYAKGRSDGTTAAENAGARARRDAEERVARDGADERLRRLRQWKR